MHASHDLEELDSLYTFLTVPSSFFNRLSKIVTLYFRLLTGQKQKARMTLYSDIRYRKAIEEYKDIENDSYINDSPDDLDSKF